MRPATRPGWSATATLFVAALAAGWQGSGLTAYGRVPAQASPPPGSYSDVVNVIITY